MIETACSNCGKAYKLRDEMVGKRVRCKACNEPFKVTVGGGKPAPAGGQPKPKPKAQAQPPSKPRPTSKPKPQAKPAPPPTPEPEPADDPLAAAMAAEASAEGAVNALPDLPPMSAAAPAPAMAQPTYQPQYSGPAQTSGLAIAALVMSFLPCVPLVGLILGVVALLKIRASGGALKGGGMAITAIVLGVIFPVCFGGFSVAFVLPGINAARKTAQQMQGVTQLRGAQVSMMLYSQGNNGYYPGIDRDGNLIDGSVEGRFQILLDENYVMPTSIVAGGDEATTVVPQGSNLTSQNYSYAMSAISGDANAGRQSVWNASEDGSQVVLSDRNIGADATSNVQSIYSTQPGEWRGGIVFNDAHVDFLLTHMPDGDNIFEALSDDDAYQIHSGE